jgi:hypothetical protein
MILPATAAANGGLCMPCKGGFRKSIEEGRRWHEERKQAWANPDPATKHWRWLVKQVYQAPGLAGQSAENQTYFMLTVLAGEVYNGGLHQFFGNSSGDHYADVVRALEETGAAECLRILVAAKQLLFGEDEVPETRAARFDYLDFDTLGPEREGELKKLDRAFGKESGKLREIIERYAHQHRLFDGF